MEVQGGVGKAALTFMIEVEKKIHRRSFDLSGCPVSVANLNLMTSLSIELQRLNSEMILQRHPRDKALEVKDASRLESAARSAITAAQESLSLKTISIQHKEEQTCEQADAFSETGLLPPCDQADPVMEKENFEEQATLQRNEPMNEHWDDLVSDEDMEHPGVPLPLLCAPNIIMV